MRLIKPLTAEEALCKIWQKVVRNGSLSPVVSREFVETVIVDILAETDRNHLPKENWVLAYLRLCSRSLLTIQEAWLELHYENNLEQEDFSNAEVGKILDGLIRQGTIEFVADKFRVLT